MTNFTMLLRDRLRLTEQAINSLRDSGCHDAKITFLDDRSQKETADFMEWLPDFMDCTVLRNLEPLGTGKLRNLVVRHSEHVDGRGEYLYLSDNDVYFKQAWLDRLTHCYDQAWKYGYRVLGAYNHPFHQPVDKLWISKMECWVHEVNALASQSMLMRWSVWDTFGPFCETPVDKVCQSEDVDFTNKIRAAGFKIGVVSPPLVVNTGITNSFGEHIPGWQMVKAQCPPSVVCE